MSIEDITDYVKELDVKREAGADIIGELPDEKIYLL